MQQGMLFHSLFEQNTGVDVIQLSCRIEGDVRGEHVSAVVAAGRSTGTRRCARRSSPATATIRCKSCSTGSNCPGRHSIGANYPRSQRRATVSRICFEADRLRGFAIDEPPLMRCALIRLDANLYQFMWTHHHLLTDGWCLPILLNEAMAIYEGLVAERHVALDTGRPFRDYIEWLARQDRDAAASFWRENLDGFTSPTRLGVDRASARLRRSRAVSSPHRSRCPRRRRGRCSARAVAPSHV